MPPLTAQRDSRSEPNAHDRSANRSRLPRINRPEVWATALVVLGVLLRAFLVGLDWLPVDSDESTMGLMALHIAFRGEHPIWLYGQSYMGALEAYLAAVSFRLFGVSVFTLRLGAILLFALFLVSMYLLAGLLYSKRLALICLALLSLGSVNMMMREVETSGGHPETLLLGTVLLLVASWLARTGDRSSSATRQRWRLIAYVGWGLAAGLGLWSHLLILPFVAMAGLLLVVFCWRELLTWAGLVLLLGMVIGAFPLIAYNLQAPPGQDSWHVFEQVARAGGTGQSNIHVLLEQKLEGTLLVSLPSATGGSSFCPLAPNTVWPLSRRSSAHIIQCSIVHGAWALGFLALWIISALLALQALWRLCHRSAPPTRLPEERRAAVVHASRLAVLGSAGITLVMFVLSPAPALVPLPSARYLVGLLIAIPAAIAPLCGEAGAQPPSMRGSVYARGLGYAALTFIEVILLVGTISTFEEIPRAQHVILEQYQLNATLERMGVTRIYGDYWTCDRIIFQTREQIICSVLGDDLSPGMDRYMPYRSIVSAAAQPAYVFPVGSAQEAAFAKRAARPGASYQRLTLDGYIIYWLTPGPPR